jgi:hypothetical protein
MPRRGRRGVTPDPFIAPRGGLAPRLAPGLLLEACDEFRRELKPRVTVEHRCPQFFREVLRRPPGDVERGGPLQQEALGVRACVDRVCHVGHDHAAHATAPLGRPARAGSEHRSDIATADLERQPVIVELGEQAKVVQHRRHIQQFGVDAHRTRRAQVCRPQVRADRVIEQGRRAVLRRDLQGRAAGRGVGDVE